MPITVKDIPYLKLEQIDYVTAKKKMKLCENATAPETFSFRFTSPTNSALSPFFGEIAKETKNRPAILSIISPYNNQFTQSSEQLPISLETIFYPINLDMDYLQLLGLPRQPICCTITINQQVYTLVSI